MRAPSLTVLLCIGSPVVFANIICDTTRAPSVASIDLDATTTCINDLCVNGDHSKPCGSLQLSVTQLRQDVVVDADACKNYFGSIISQCAIIEQGGVFISNEVLYEIKGDRRIREESRGVSDSHSVQPDLETRTRSRRRPAINKSKTPNASKPPKPNSPLPNAKSSSSTLKAKPILPTTNAKSNPSTPEVKPATTTVKPPSPTSKDNSTPTPKKNPKSTPAASSTLTSNTNGTSASCGTRGANKTKPITPSKKKNGIRDVFESFIPSSLLPRNPPQNPPQNKGKAPQNKGKTPQNKGKAPQNKGKAPATEVDSDSDTCGPTERYFKRPLSAKANHYRFDKSVGWDSSTAYTNAEKHVRNVFDKMTENGFFNVIEFYGANQETFCVGDPGRNDPMVISEQAASKREKCIITNGNYFVLPGSNEDMEWEFNGPVIQDLKKYKGFSIGWTSTDRPGEKSFLPPSDYQRYYEKFEGTDGSFMYCGPSLIQDVEFERAEFCKDVPKLTEHNIAEVTAIKLHNKVYGSIPGSLSHASRPHNRLVTVIMSKTSKFIFSYTSTRQALAGLNLNEMRALIDTFLREFTSAPNGIAGAQQALNMDGGGSVFVNFINGDGEMELIAAGKLDTKKAKHVPRKVQTVVRHSILEKRLDWHFGV
ncbi:hypothetical protein DM02DRAFT_626808 [Periconia macrospinosa]|uniref:Uncharacterized protein n=1 Tax=Periconia macrospinosa TaxID=97972 RepID=A0A2V1DVC5_9PLEO|nr:hypothetical protein DM02DRAFT_626808 [Periconia macrospinosa]